MAEIKQRFAARAIERGRDRTHLAERILDWLEQTRLVTEADLATGKTIDTLIRNTAEELGEFCKAVAVEDGYKNKKLDESSKIEAVDAIICALSLFYGRGGTQEELAEYIALKLPKWEARVHRHTQEAKDRKLAEKYGLKKNRRYRITSKQHNGVVGNYQYMSQGKAMLRIDPNAIPHADQFEQWVAGHAEYTLIPVNPKHLEKL